jgi:hypothetical protein
VIDFVDRIYPIELEIKDTTYTDRSASYLDLHLEIDSIIKFAIKDLSILMSFFEGHVKSRPSVETDTIV